MRKWLVAMVAAKWDTTRMNVRNLLKKDEDPEPIKTRGRKAYIAWEEDEVTSNTSDAENKDEDDLCFMGQMKKAKNEVIFQFRFLLLF